MRGIARQSDQVMCTAAGTVRRTFGDASSFCLYTLSRVLRVALTTQCREQLVEWPDEHGLRRPPIMNFPILCWPAEAVNRPSLTPAPHWASLWERANVEWLLGLAYNGLRE
jgi:hypothetical protein